MQRRGLLTATICTYPFEKMARQERKSLGMPELPLIIIGHPLGGLRPEEVGARVDEAVEAFAKLMPSK